MTMDLGMSEKVAPLVEKIRDFTRNYVAPLNEEFDSLIGTGPNGRFSYSERQKLGWVHMASEAMNCSAPDTGNMEVLERYGTPEHKEKWLKPLLEGKIRSAYLMTEPDVASSDATNLQFSAVKDGDEWVLNGEKYWSSGAGDPRCKVFILMAHTPSEERSKHLFGHDDAPHGHMHVRFTNVRIPADALLIREGAGFEVSLSKHVCFASKPLGRWIR